MDKFLGKLSLYDMIVMIIPGGAILLFFLDYYGIDLLSANFDKISPLAIFLAVIASYIIGMGNHVLSKKFWKALRNNYLLLSYSLKKSKNAYTLELNKLTENLQDCNEIMTQSKIKLRDKYYEAYSYVLEKSRYDGISVIESQTAFLQSMVIPGLFILIYLAKYDLSPLLLGGIFLFLLLFYLIFDRIILIHKQVWEYYEYTKRIEDNK